MQYVDSNKDTKGCDKKYCAASMYSMYNITCLPQKYSLTHLPHHPCGGIQSF